MLKTLTLVFTTCMLFCFSSCQQKEEPATTCFPEVSGPIALTSGPMEHLFASYYGINSWSRNQRYATVLETSIRDTIPTENDPATLGLVDMETMEFVPLCTTGPGTSSRAVWPIGSEPARIR